VAEGLTEGEQALVTRYLRAVARRMHRYAQAAPHERTAPG